MEGGKIMKSKIYLKIVFVVILTAILFCLIFIIYDKAGTRAHIYEPLSIADYIIKDESSSCNKGEEKIYEDKNYNYYLTCMNSYDIYLVWSDGGKDLVKNALQNNKVTIESLQEHGLTIVKHEK